jgi:hypothetical protein
MLDVTFENGDHFLLPTGSVLQSANHAQIKRSGQRSANTVLAPRVPDWAKMRIGETGDVLEVPAVEAVIEIPWDRIRSIADPNFRAQGPSRRRSGDVAWASASGQ